MNQDKKRGKGDDTKTLTTTNKATIHKNTDDEDNTRLATTGNRYNASEKKSENADNTQQQYQMKK